jgi:hypothetical protein
MARRLLILMVITFWALMTGIFIKRNYLFEGSASEGQTHGLLDPEYRMGVYYGEHRIGEFRFNSYPWTDAVERGYRLVSGIHLDYPPVGEAHINGESFTDEKLFLRKFEYYIKYKLKMIDEQDVRLEGIVKEGKFRLTLKLASIERSFEMPAPGGISLYDPVTPWIVGKKFRPGREYTVQVLNRFTRSPQIAKVRVLRSKRITFGEETIAGYEVEATVGDLKSLFWMGRDGKVYRMESPLGFVLVREPIPAPERSGS